MKLIILLLLVKIINGKNECNLVCNTVEDKRTCKLDCDGKGLSNLRNEFILNEDINIVIFSNNNIEYLSDDLFNKKSMNILLADFAYNHINLIDEETFKSMGSLNKLILTSNNIWHLPENLFQNLINLIDLDLSENHIAHWFPTTFKSLMKLIYLNLSKNHIYILQSDSFKFLINLEKLNLDNNDISYLPENLFQNNYNLKYLNLANNPLKFLPNLAIQSASNLRTLDLSSTSLEQLTYKDFKNLTKLEIIYLNKINNLFRINEYTFQDLISLKKFFCNYNTNFRVLNEKAFTINQTNKLINLREFHLRFSRIQTLSETFLNWSNTVKQIDLTGSPINCDCKISWLFKLNFSQTQLSQNTRCYRPWRLKGEQLISLNKNKLSCNFFLNLNYDLIGLLLLFIVFSMLLSVFVYIFIKFSICSKTLSFVKRSERRRRNEINGKYVRVFHNTEQIDLEFDTSGQPS